jgi:hypothetical protein
MQAPKRTRAVCGEEASVLVLLLALGTLANAQDSATARQYQRTVRLVLLDGSCVTAALLDSSGCKLKVKQGAQVAEVWKADVVYMLDSSDTVRYGGHSPDGCPPSPRQHREVAKALQSTIQALPTRKTGLVSPATVYFCSTPIAGDVEPSTADSASAEYRSYLSTKFTVVLVDHGRALELLQRGQSDRAYLLVPMAFEGKVSEKGILGPGSVRVSEVPALTPSISVPLPCYDSRLEVVAIDLKEHARCMSIEVHTCASLLDLPSPHTRTGMARIKDGTYEQGVKSIGLRCCCELVQLKSHYRVW